MKRCSEKDGSRPQAARGQTGICSECACFVKIIASIEDPSVINQTLTHLTETAATALLPDCRASPTAGLLV